MVRTYYENVSVIKAIADKNYLGFMKHSTINRFLVAISFDFFKSFGL